MPADNITLKIKELICINNEKPRSLYKFQPWRVAIVLEIPPSWSINWFLRAQMDFQRGDEDLCILETHIELWER